MPWDLSPKTIIGKRVQLEPLAPALFDSLCECLLGEPDGWFSKRHDFNKPEQISAMIEGSAKSNQERRSLTFVIRDLATSKVAGVSSLMKIDEKNRQLEIGATQVGRHFRRSHVNTETKFLMLKEAFETLGAARVYFKVDTENLVSQKAVLRIGAKHEGILRKDFILPNGKSIDFCVYSILDSEWPEIKAQLIKSKP